MIELVSYKDITAYKNCSFNHVFSITTRDITASNFYFELSKDGVKKFEFTESHDDHNITISLTKTQLNTLPEGTYTIAGKEIVTADTNEKPMMLRSFILREFPAEDTA